MAFARWDPIRDLLAVHGLGKADWRPQVDLHETPAEYVVTAELPGLSGEDIDIRLDQDGCLTLSGIRREPVETCGQYQQIERGRGSFSRTFHLPLSIDSAGITAEMHDGVLTVRCPKTSNPGARRVHVS